MEILRKIECILLKPGMYVLKIETEEAKDQVPEQSPWPLMSKYYMSGHGPLTLDLSKGWIRLCACLIELPNVMQALQLSEEI